VLGGTLAKIAAEKAGIIKPGVPAFIGLQPPAAEEVFRGAARERGSRAMFLAEEMTGHVVSLSAGGTHLHLELRGRPAVDFHLSMLGEFQAENAALACLALAEIHPEITPAQFEEGFRQARLPGRMELFGGDPPLVLDGAHTPLAVRRLAESFAGIFVKPGRPRGAVLLFGSVAGKNPLAMAEVLAPRFESIVVSTPGTFKASDPAEVAEIFRGLNPRTQLVPDPEAALARVRELSGGTLPVLVTGSFYMVAEIRRML